MKTLTTIFFFIAICVSVSAQKTLSLKGTIGKYANEDGCVIIVTVGEKEVELVANTSMDCGFGARAHMDHTLIKVSDEVLEPNDDWIGLDDILKR